MEGYIKIYRQLLDWEWYTDTPTKSLFIHLLLKANIKDSNWRWTPVQKWSLITGRKKLSEETWLSESQIRTSLEKLQSTNEIAIKVTKSFSVIELNNWDKYQDWIANRITNESPSNRQAIATGEESNKEINKEVITVKDDVYMQAWHLSITHDEFSKLEKEYWWEKADEVVQWILNYRKNTKYKSLYLTALTWLKRDKKKLEEPIKRVHVTTDYSKL